MPPNWVNYVKGQSGSLLNKSLLSEKVHTLCECGEKTTNIFYKNSVIHFEGFLFLTQLKIVINISHLLN